MEIFFLQILKPAMEGNIVQEVQEENNENDKETEKQFIVTILNDALNAINLLWTAVIFKELFHINSHYGGSLIKI